MTRAEVDALRAIMAGIMGLAAAADAILARHAEPEVQMEEMPLPPEQTWLGKNDPPAV